MVVEGTDLAPERLVRIWLHKVWLNVEYSAKSSGGGGGGSVKGLQRKES
jgi:hypothetical protein